MRREEQSFSSPCQSVIDLMVGKLTRRPADTQQLQRRKAMAFNLELDGRRDRL
jgi:hypothetical protein